MLINAVGEYILINAVMHTNPTIRDYCTQAVKEIIDSAGDLTILNIEAKIAEYQANVLGGDPPYVDPPLSITPFHSGQQP